jgi:hypothetical protein
VAEIAHRSAERKNGLANVDDFRGAFADGVNAEQLEILPKADLATGKDHESAIR